MNSWIVWLIVAAVLGVAELLTTTLAFGLIAIAAVVAAVVGAFHLGLAFQLAAFVIASGAGIGFVRPIAMKHIKQPPGSWAVRRSSWRRSPSTAGGSASAARSGPRAPTMSHW